MGGIGRGVGEKKREIEKTASWLCIKPDSPSGLMSQLAAGYGFPQ